MKKITVREVIKATGAQMIALGDMEAALNREIGYITQDSRETKEGVLFVARIGEVRDGHDFLPQCFENGVTACLSQKVVAPKNGAVLLLVPDTGKALLDLTAYYRDLFDIPYVGVTGSVGKTTTKDMIASVLSQKYNTLWTAGNYNNEVGVPLTMFRIEEEHEAAVIEMGMNHFGEIDRIAKAVRPHIGVISNVGVAHIEHLGSREGILKAKCEMLGHMDETGVAILNADNDMLQTLEGKLPQKTVWFGIENKKDFYADEIEQIGLEKTACTIHTPIGDIRVDVPIPGVHMVLNALSAAAVGVELGLTLEQVKAGIETFQATKNRMSIEKTKDGITVLNDVYNSNPVSCKASIDILANAPGRKIAMLGYMGELGDYEEAGHREVGIHAVEKGIDMLFCVGLCCEYMADAARKAGMQEVYYMETQEEFWEKGIPMLQEGDTILLKASRSREFEKTVAKLQGVN
ncbi:MAG: UDP-N-acetylmuramoyl-tripeptide--D-alanyl-D-alanine ligase [Anaerotignum sp.]|nr:UDP-N-acetylmuramoyl-tripeptide--D-alanyl-D-alanine ligase [Anaerotignum sp.]